MRTFGYALLCGIGGAVVAKLLGSLGYALVYGGEYRHPMRDAFEFAVMAFPGLLWGMAVGAVCARTMPAAGIAKVATIGLGVTVGVIGVVAGGITWPQYLVAQNELPREALLDGRKLILEFELMLPPGQEYPRDIAGGEFFVDAGSGASMSQPVPVAISAAVAPREDGRAVLTGRVPLETTTWRNLQFVTRRNTVRTMPLRGNGTPRRADLDWSPWWPALNDPDAGRTDNFHSRARLQFTAGP